ncbi:peptidylprolyl isomerase [Thalassotalea euphylliae]|uniref:FKBP-type peptidyl-prolyl cis-trans isomerase n=1 Tax=Thalassotalea euphylliae TaxID=1655234 RepID=UPI0036312312
MKIANNSVVKLHYAVSDSEGTTIDSSYDHEPLEIIQGTGYLIPGLEKALEGREAGETFEVDVSAADAYGERFDEYVQTVPKELMQGVEDLEVGTQLRATTDEGEQTVIVIDVNDTEITVDGNHPLAGIDLHFDVELLAVREATAEELEHGHVHKESSCCDANGKGESCCD